MREPEVPATQAVRFLRQNNIKFIPHFYKYEEHGGTKVASRALNVPENEVVKTIVMLIDGDKPIIVLMHGDREISEKNLARFIGVKKVEPCDPRRAEKFTGYVFGGMSPFGTRRSLPVYVEKSIFDLKRVFINGGKRGFLVEIQPSSLKVLLPIEVNIATKIDGIAN